MLLLLVFPISAVIALAWQVAVLYQQVCVGLGGRVFRTAEHRGPGPGALMARCTIRVMVNLRGVWM
jgi:hypothetical protein